MLKTSINQTMTKLLKYGNMEISGDVIYRLVHGYFGKNLELINEIHTSL